MYINTERENKNCVTHCTTVCITKMVQAENNFSRYEVCPKSMRIWYHAKAEQLLFLLLFIYYFLLL